MSEESKAEKIVEYGRKGNLKKVTHYCEDGNAILRVAAAQGLGLILSEDSNNMLLSMVHDKSTEVQKAVVLSLGKLCHKNSEEYIRHVLNRSTDEGVQVACHQAMDELSKHAQR